MEGGRINKLDFIIIGAARAATTSLADYLGQSKQIFIPSEKEIPYFLDARMQEKGWDRYCDTYFYNADREKQLWGTATPQYMMFPECFDSIGKLLPDVKMIAVLRDPIERLISHFALMKRFGFENRPLNQVIEEQLSRIDYYRSEASDIYTDKYLVSGEYGRILDELFRHFDSSQVLIIHFDDIMQDAQKVLDRVSDFLEIDYFTPENVGCIRLGGGSRKRINIDHYKIFSRLAGFLQSVGFRGLKADRLRSKVGVLSSWLDEINVAPSSKMSESDIRPDVLQRLREHYRTDAMMLEALGIDAPWINEDWRVV